MELGATGSGHLLYPSERFIFCIFFSSQKVMLIAHGKQIECIKTRKLKYWEFQVCCLSHLCGSWRWKEFWVLSCIYNLFIGSLNYLTLLVAKANHRNTIFKLSCSSLFGGFVSDPCYNHSTQVAMKVSLIIILLLFTVWLSPNRSKEISTTAAVFIVFIFIATAQNESHFAWADFCGRFQSFPYQLDA